jgi:4-carboxymuconolactone decarboxylase
MMHVAVYAGVPAANHAFKIVKATLAAMASDPDAAGPTR